MKQKILEFITRRETILIAMAVVIVYAAFATVGVIMRNLELKQDIAKTKEEIEVLRLQNENLRHNIEYYKTDAYIEEVLREQLGYAKPGETVLVFPDQKAQKEDEAEKQKELSFLEQSRENFEAWVDFFVEK